MKHVSSLQTMSVLFTVGLTFAGFVLSANAEAASLQNVACPAKGQPSVELFDQKGSHLGIRLVPFEVINAFQGWGKNDITIREKNRPLRLIRVQVPGQKNLSTQSFFIQKADVTSLANCEQRRGAQAPMAIAQAPQIAHSPTPAMQTISLPPSKVADKPAAKPADKPVQAPVSIAKVAPKNTNDAATDEGDDEGADDSAAPEHEATVSVNGVGGLTNLHCCDFPLTTRPRSFLGGMGRFGARRAKGRTHGGADLYGRRNQPILAVTNGIVIRPPYFFKKRTLALDVRHQGGFIVRYGEINGRSFGLHLNSLVRIKQQIGAMGFVPGAPAPMLHFELYKGTQSGKLSEPGRNRFSRRGDLTNPTQFLLRWEKNK